MKKISLILSIFIIVLFISSSIVLAESNMLREAGNSIMNAAQGAVSGVENMIKNGANSIMNTTDNMADNNTTGTEQTNKMDMGATNRNADEDYTATRTAVTSQGNVLGLSTTAWTWLIIAIVGALIVGMVYFYGKQYNTMSTTDSHRDE